MKYGFYLYREYSKKLRKKQKLATALFGISITILLIVNIAGSIFNRYIDAMTASNAVKDIIVYIPGADYSAFRAAWQGDAHVVSMDMKYEVQADAVDAPKGAVKGRTFHIIRANVARQCERIDEKTDLKDNEVVIPKYIFQSNHPSIDMTATAYLNGEQFIGQKISVAYAGKSWELQIRDVYDNAMLSEDGKYYITEELARQMSGGFPDITELQVEVLDYEDQELYIDKFRDWISEKIQANELPEESDGYGSMVHAAGYMEKDAVGFVRTAMLLVVVLSAVALIWACFGIALSQLKGLQLRKQEFGLLKAIGYKNRQLAAMLRTEALMLSVRVLTVTGSIVCIALAAYTTYILAFTNPLWHFLLPTVDIWFLLGTIAVGILIPLLAYEIAIRKLKKMQR